MVGMAGESAESTTRSAGRVPRHDTETDQSTMEERLGEQPSAAYLGTNGRRPEAQEGTMIQRGTGSRMTSAYPINSRELTRRLGYRKGDEDWTPTLRRVRSVLRRFNCPKAGNTQQAWWLVDEEMERRVKAAL